MSFVTKWFPSTIIGELNIPFSFYFDSSEKDNPDSNEDKLDMTSDNEGEFKFLCAQNVWKGLQIGKCIFLIVKSVARILYRMRRVYSSAQYL